MLSNPRHWGERSRTAAALVAAVIPTLVLGSLLPVLTQLQAALLVGIIALALASLWRPAVLPMVLYSLVLIPRFGLLTLAPLGGYGPIDGNDVLWGLLLLVTLPLYLRQRRTLGTRWLFHLERAWGIIVLVMIIQALRSPADTVSERVDNLHVVEGFLLFFPTVGIVTTRRRLGQFAALGLLIAVLGTILTVAQSLHGLDNLTSSPYYDTGAWAGNKQMVGAIARVNLPVSDWVAFVVVVIVAASLLRFNGWYPFLAGFLALTILVNFARTLWLGIGLTFLVQVVVLLAVGRMRNARALRLLVIPVSLLLALWVAPYIGLQGIADALTGRIDEGLFFFQSDTGTLAARQLLSAFALGVWENNMLLGVGTNYYRVLGFYVDVGFIETLVSVGLVGTIGVLYVLLVCGLEALAALRAAARRAELLPMVLALGVVGELVVMAVYRQLSVNPYMFAILGFASALTVIAGTGAYAAAERLETLPATKQRQRVRRTPVPALAPPALDGRRRQTALSRKR